MNAFGKKIVGLTLIGFQHTVFAAEHAVPGASTGGLLKVSLGLSIVLAVMALIAWGIKRFMPGGLGQQSVVRVVGGASVGTRERVVVLEIANRWIVVGVAPGQISSLANLEVGTPTTLDFPESAPQFAQSVHPAVAPLVKPFSEWLKKSAEKIRPRS